MCKFTKIIEKIFLNQDIQPKLRLDNMLPNVSKINFEKDLTYQIEFKNINYLSVNDNVFKVECKVM